RAMSAEDLQKNVRGSGLIVDGYMVPEDLTAVFQQGKQNAVDVLVGSNKDEGTFFGGGRGGGKEAGVDQFTRQAKQRWSDRADDYLKLYPVSTDEQAKAAGLENTRDMVAWHARYWAQLQTKVGKKAYWYYFTHEQPALNGNASRGATHTAELPYA